MRSFFQIGIFKLKELLCLQFGRELQKKRSYVRLDLFAPTNICRKVLYHRALCHNTSSNMSSLIILSL